MKAATSQRHRQSSASADARRSRRLFSRPTHVRHNSVRTTPLHSTMTLPPPARRRFLSRPSANRPPRRVFARLSQPRRPASPPGPSEQPLLFEPNTSDISDSASNDAPQSSSHTDLVFIDDVPHVKFCNVGEEEEPLVPESATPYISSNATSSAPMCSSLAALTRQNDLLTGENYALQRKNAVLEAELEAVRCKSSAMAAELAAMTRQFHDVRSKLSRKVRYLEAELTSINSSSTATSTQQSRSSRARVVNGVAANALPPSHDAQPSSSSSRAFARVQSLGSVSESCRRRSTRPVTVPIVHSSSGTGSVRRAFDTDTNVASPASRARQGLIRRAFVAHIHAHRYRTARQAWLHFLGAEQQQVTLVTFSACVRKLAVAAEASDRELQLLMQEICEVGVGPHTVMSWNMFSRFYSNTKNEST